jgi:hypothetical protein
VLDNHVADLYPEWRHGQAFRPTAIRLFHNVSAEQLELVERLPPTPDSLVNSVSMYSEVLKAARRYDRASPETHPALAVARMEAQRRAGVSEADLAPMYSAEIEDLLTPLLMRAGRGDEIAIVDHLRQRFHRVYGEKLGEFILMFALRTYRHHSTERLLEVAKATAAVAA